MIGIPGFSRGKTEFTKIAIDGNGVPYVAYRGDYFKITVMRFDGTNWTSVGNPGFAEGTYLSIVINKDGVPYVVYSNKNDGDKVTVMKYSR